MKKTLLLALVSLLGISNTQAQTLTAATNNPAPGDIFYGRICDTTGVTMGASGAGATWDFSSLHVVDSSDTMRFVTCASTPYCDSFAGSNIAMRQDSTYVYGITGTSGVQMIGTYDSGEYSHFTNPMDYLFFPMSLSIVHKDTATSAVASMFGTLYLTVNTISSVDGSGTLKLPGTTYTNALRVHRVQTMTDSINAMGMPFVTVSTTENYSWYVAGFHYPVLSIDYDTAGAAAPYVSNVEYYKRNTTAGIAEATMQSLKVYPNPTSDMLHIRFTADAPVTITLTDMVGHDVATMQAGKGAQEISYNTADLAAGVYLMRMATADGAVTTRKVTVIK